MDTNNGSDKEEVPKLQPIRQPLNVTAISVLGLFILATLYTFYFAREFFLPVTLAWMLSLLFKPVIRGGTKLHLPEALSALLLLLTLVVSFLAGILFLSGPASDWIKKAPESMERAEGKIRGMLSSAHELTEAAHRVEHLADRTSDQTPKVELKKPGPLSSVLGRTKVALFMAAEVFVLLFFFLAAGDIFTLKLIQILPRLRDKKRAVEIVRETERGISQYLFSMTLVNLYEGVAIGTGLGLLGMPNPVLWGVLAFTANYVPYLGALFAGGIITMVALVSFDSFSKALIAPAIYYGVNFSDNFIAPFIMGRRLVLNPVIVFLAIVFWGWIWGIAGVLIAVPMTMIFKIICDHIPVLAPFGEFLAAPRAEKVTATEVLKPVKEKPEENSVDNPHDTRPGRLAAKCP
jgi:predicted PurR-regulated permease PerM